VFGKILAREYSDASYFEVHRLIVDAYAIPPVMSYFEPQKTTSAGRSFIEGQHTIWAQLVSQAEVVGVVGIRVREQDIHIWEPLKNTVYLYIDKIILFCYYLNQNKYQEIFKYI